MVGGGEEKWWCDVDAISLSLSSQIPSMRQCRVSMTVKTPCEIVHIFFVLSQCIPVILNSVLYRVYNHFHCRIPSSRQERGRHIFRST